MQVELIAVSELLPYAQNAKAHPDEQIAKLASMIKNYGFNVPVLVDAGLEVIAGHGRILAARRLGLEQVPCIRIEHLSPAQVKAFRIADNKVAESDWLLGPLALELAELGDMDFDLSLTGFDQGEIDALLRNAEDGGTAGEKNLGSLADRFGVPPFTVLNAREGWWQDRKKAWLALGIKSEVGRGENLLNFSPAAQLQRKGPATVSGKAKVLDVAYVND